MGGCFPYASAQAHRAKPRAAGISNTARSLTEKLGDEDFLREIAARLLKALEDIG
jgi:hypothetical protein